MFQYLPNLLSEFFCLRWPLRDDGKDSRQEEILTSFDGGIRFLATQVFFGLPRMDAVFIPFR